MPTNDPPFFIIKKRMDLPMPSTATIRIDPFPQVRDLPLSRKVQLQLLVITPFIPTHPTHPTHPVRPTRPIYPVSPICHLIRVTRLPHLIPLAQ